MKNSHPSETTYAFFDVDDTIIHDKSMFSFANHWFNLHPDTKKQKAFEQDMSKRFSPQVCWSELNYAYYRHFKGRHVKQVQDACTTWFQHQMQYKTPFLIDAVIHELQWHHQQGHEVVFVSGSFTELLKPIAEHLEVKHILATNLADISGIYTGELIPPQTIGEGKMLAIKVFSQKNNDSLSNSYAYGDDITDLPMLEMVGNPVVVTGGRNLVDIAQDRDWPILSHN